MTFHITWHIYRGKAQEHSFVLHYDSYDLLKLIVYEIDLRSRNIGKYQYEADNNACHNQRIEHRRKDLVILYFFLYNSDQWLH